MRYLEYEISTGKIISEIISDNAPELDEDRGVIVIGDEAVIDASRFIVKDGVLAKAYETKNEQIERERLRKEYREKSLRRIKSMMTEYFVAVMENDNDAINELRSEYKELKAYL